MAVHVIREGEQSGKCEKEKMGKMKGHKEAKGNKGNWRKLMEEMGEEE